MRNRPISWLAVDQEEKNNIFAQLKKNNIQLKESELLEHIGDNNYTSICALEALGLIGSERAIKPLKTLVYGTKGDVPGTALMAIARIAGAKENKYYAQLILDPVYKDKIAPASILWELGGKDALPEMRLVAEQIIHRKVKDVQWDNDPLYISEYLRKFSKRVDDIELAKQLENLYKKAAWGYLDYINDWLSRLKGGKDV